MAITLTKNPHTRTQARGKRTSQATSFERMLVANAANMLAREDGDTGQTSTNAPAQASTTHHLPAPAAGCALPPPAAPNTAIERAPPRADAAPDGSTRQHTSMTREQMMVDNATSMLAREEGDTAPAPAYTPAAILASSADQPGTGDQQRATAYREPSQ